MCQLPRGKEVHLCPLESLPQEADYLHSAPLGTNLERRSTAQLVTLGRWTAQSDSKFICAHSRSLWTTRWRLGDRKPPWWFM